MAPTAPLVASLFRLSNAMLQEDSSMLQMPVAEQALQRDIADSNCTCPGYFEEQCRAHAHEGCTWTDDGESNAPWCQCRAPDPNAQAPAAVCPAGWEQRGASGADIGGCGLQSCGDRYDITSAAACAARCDGNGACVGFSFAPYNGDRNHPGVSACTIYNSDNPTGTWTGTQGRATQVFCARAPPPAPPPPPPPPPAPACTYQPGDGVGGNEDYIGDADSEAACAALVLEQCPYANGATYSSGANQRCYCEFSMTDWNTSPSWKSCMFADFVPESVPQCQGGVYVTGDGLGGTEEYLQDAASPQECVQIVKEQRPTANGATVSIRGSGRCYAEFNMDHVEHDDTNWQTCLFEHEGCIGNYEAEDATISGAREHTPPTTAPHQGFTGRSFVDYINANNDYIEWSFPSCTAGAVTLSFRYALASGDRPLKVLVNGVEITSSLSTPATGAWSNYDTVDLPATFVAGANTVKLQANGRSGANVDSLIIS